MEGEGIVRIRPDAARIRVGVVSEGASPTEVAQENATRMSSVVDAVKKSVGEPALSSGTVEIRTDAATLTPIYADRGSHPAALNGYRANNSLRVLIRELDQRSPGFLGAIIEQANKVGANEISGPEFLVFNDAKPLVEARVNAIEDARTKAETYAKALNVRLGRVIAVKELERSHGPMPMMARSASQADAAPPIETGTNEIVARVTVVWELKQDWVGEKPCHRPCVRRCERSQRKDKWQVSGDRPPTRKSENGWRSFLERRRQAVHALGRL